MSPAMWGRPACWRRGGPGAEEGSSVTDGRVESDQRLLPGGVGFCARARGIARSNSQCENCQCVLRMYHVYVHMRWGSNAAYGLVCYGGSHGGGGGGGVGWGVTAEWVQAYLCVGFTDCRKCGCGAYCEDSNVCGHVF